MCARQARRESDMLDWMQWPAMAVTILAAWFVASRSPTRRLIGFWLFLMSNALWIVWGVPARAYALVLLQLCLALMNVRGERRNSKTTSA